MANIYKWMFKTSCAILILSNTFNIVMAVFDVSQSVIAQSAGLIQGSTDITPDMLAELEAEEDDLQFAMTAYGLCVLLETRGETEKADALREKLLKRDGFWFCFSYLAAYSDYKYTVKPAAVT